MPIYNRIGQVIRNPLPNKKNVQSIIRWKPERGYGASKSYSSCGGKGGRDPCGGEGAGKRPSKGEDSPACGGSKGGKACATEGGGGACSCGATIYDKRKYGHNLSKEEKQRSACFDPLGDIPSGVFRCTEGEQLGLGAGKECCYKNPEYFSFHHMSFFDFHLNLRKYRLPAPDTQRKPKII